MIKIDSQGQTALHYACRQGNENIVRLLLENGSDVNVKTNPSIVSSNQGDIVFSLYFFGFHLKYHQPC